MPVANQPMQPFAAMFSTPLPWMNRPDDLVHPLAPLMRCQQVWWTLSLKAYEQEIEFIRMWQTKSMEMGQCLLSTGFVDPQESKECLTDIVSDVQEHTVKRLQRLQGLTDELKEAIWEEI
ncbi:hypothetical protein F8A90_09075 [Cobetia sp. cqz5-12]|uniref:hypothetical protein n=1 Tax=unclassified Cobetia TaxID=2609414 RepID=UPI001409BEBB|nr:MULTISPECIES: hypothetical protein [unclassified Cobetia]NHH85066.1 hypothetical protein [Cobetia sp. MB87]QQK64258.1 hypothetical protein F8A90_09075 [Cobetia sp. cqz5-12]